jgi:tetratricopeptide (TPR) repeat protein
MTLRSGKGKRKTPSQSATATYQAGLAAFEQGRYPEAIELLSTIADQRNLPSTLGRFYLGQARFHQGISELRLGRCAAAARHLTAARQANPGSANLSRYLLACHVGRGRFDLAAAELEKDLDRGSDDRDLPIKLAHALARDGQYNRAVETLDQAIYESPQRADFRLQLGLLQAAAEEFDAAVQTLTGAAALAPLDADVRQHLGLALGARGDVSQAVQHLAVAQKLRPHDAYTALLLTLAIDAAQALRAEDDPAHKAEDGPAHGAVCGTGVSPVSAPAERQCHNDDDAIETLGHVITKDPDFVEAFLSLPESDVDPEIFAMLAAILERALERHPDYADLHYHCSRVYARLGRTESAITEADRAVRINPRYVQALIQLGRLYADTDRSAEAIDRLQAAVENGGDYPDVHLMLGDLHQESGRTEHARVEYHRALELNSNYSRARSALEALATA